MQIYHKITTIFKKLKQTCKCRSTTKHAEGQHELQSQALYVVHTLLNMSFNCVMFAALHLVNIIRICFCFACQYSLCIPAADPPLFITKTNVTHIHISFLFFECHGLIEKHCGHDRETLCVIRCR